MRVLGRILRGVDEWIDTGVAALLLAAGAVLAVTLAFDGATAVEVGLVVLLLAFASLRWAMISHAWRPLRKGDQRDQRGPPGA